MYYFLISMLRNNFNKKVFSKLTDSASQIYNFVAKKEIKINKWLYLQGDNSKK